MLTLEEIDSPSLIELSDMEMLPMISMDILSTVTIRDLNQAFSLFHSSKSLLTVIWCLAVIPVRCYCIAHHMVAQAISG